jgi:hypothetical protein
VITLAGRRVVDCVGDVAATCCVPIRSGREDRKAVGIAPLGEHQRAPVRLHELRIASHARTRHLGIDRFAVTGGWAARRTRVRSLRAYTSA